MHGRMNGRVKRIYYFGIIHYEFYPKETSTKKADFIDHTRVSSYIRGS